MLGSSKIQTELELDFKLASLSSRARIARRASHLAPVLFLGLFSSLYSFKFSTGVALVRKVPGRKANMHLLSHFLTKAWLVVLLVLVCSFSL